MMNVIVYVAGVHVERESEWLKLRAHLLGNRLFFVDKQRENLRAFSTAYRVLTSFASETRLTRELSICHWKEGGSLQNCCLLSLTLGVLTFPRFSGPWMSRGTSDIDNITCIEVEETRTRIGPRLITLCFFRRRMLSIQRPKILAM